MAAMIQNANGDYADEAKQDLFNEVLVKQRWGAHEYALLGLIISGSFFILFIMLLFFDYVLPFIPLLLVALGFGIYFLIKGLRKEYEYIATNGSLDIDCIIAQNKRKRLLSFNPSDIEEVAAVAEAQALKNQSKQAKVMDCSSREKTAALWCVSGKSSGGKFRDKQVLVIIDGNPKILNNLKRFIPAKVKYQGQI